MSLWLLVRCGTLRRRFSFSSRLPLLVEWGNSRRFLGRYLFLVLMFFSLTFRNFVRRLSLQSIRCLAPFVFGPWQGLSAIFQKKSFSVLCVLCDIVSCTASLSPRPRSLFVSPRTPSRPLSKNALNFFLQDVISRASSFSSSSTSSGCSSSSSSRSSSASLAHSVGGRLSGMPLFPLSLWQVLGPLLRSLPPSISLMFSFLPRKVLVWVLWWRRVPWFRYF